MPTSAAKPNDIATALAGTLAGHDIQREPIAAKSLIGYVPDQPYLPEKLTAREFLEFIAGLYQIDRTAAIGTRIQKHGKLRGGDVMPVLVERRKKTRDDHLMREAQQRADHWRRRLPSRLGAVSAIIG